MPDLRDRMMEQFEKAVRLAWGGADDALAFMFKLAAGRFKTCPFGAEGLVVSWSLMRDMLGMTVSVDVVATGQLFHLPLMARLLRAYGDPDWSFVQGIGEGVPLGVDEDLPRTPAVFEEKGKWRLTDDAGPGADTNDNYKSVAPTKCEPCFGRRRLWAG